MGVDRCGGYGRLRDRRGGQGSSTFERWLSCPGWRNPYSWATGNIWMERWDEAQIECPVSTHWVLVTVFHWSPQMLKPL